MPTVNPKQKGTRQLPILTKLRDVNAYLTQEMETKFIYLAEIDLYGITKMQVKQNLAMGNGRPIVVDNCRYFVLLTRNEREYIQDRKFFKKTQAEKLRGEKVRTTKKKTGR